MSKPVVRWCCLAVAMTFVCGTRTAPAVADEKHLFERIDAAIDSGVAWLRKRQLPDGSWGPIGKTPLYGGAEGDSYRHPNGPTALALYTLLKCGVPPDDAGIRKGFDFIEKLDPIAVSSYEVAATILAVEAKYDQVKREARRVAAAALRSEPGKRPDLRVRTSRGDGKWLDRLVGALDAKFVEGGWRYGFENAVNRGAKQDMSATGFSMLASLAAHRCGVNLPKKTVLAAAEWTLAQQETTGPLALEAKPSDPGATWAPAADVRARGWAYAPGSPIKSEAKPPSGNMTTAGLIVLLSAQHILEDTSPESMKTLQPRIDRAVGDGIAWLGVHWRVDANPDNGANYHTMYLYGLERVGDLRRVAFLAGRDWFAEGAQVLVDSQQEGGSWTGNTHEPKDVLNTCFALLFLDRASLLVTTPK